MNRTVICPGIGFPPGASLGSRVGNLKYNFELTLPKSESSVRVIFWVIAQLPSVSPRFSRNALCPAPERESGFLPLLTRGVTP
jgi:hypothetical protein